MPLPHITTSLSGQPRLPLGVSATCFTSRAWRTHQQAAIAIDLFHFLPYSHSMAEMAGTHGPHCSSRKPQRSPIRGMCFTLHGIVCVYIPVLLFDTQQLKELNLSNSGLVPQLCTCKLSNVAQSVFIKSPAVVTITAEGTELKYSPNLQGAHPVSLGLPDDPMHSSMESI